MRLTRGEIIDQALQRAGNNTASLKAQARIKLNRILQDLYLQWDWPFLWRTAAVTIPPNTVFPLPADFVKTEDDQSLFAVDAGIPLQEVDHLHFTRIARPGAESTVPRVWTIDYNQRIGIAWPRPLYAVAATLRHKYLPPDFPVTPPADYVLDVPTFPWDSYLSDAVLQWAMEYEADPRADSQLMKNDQQLGLIRGATWPERSYRSTIPLDPTVFSTPWRGE